MTGRPSHRNSTGFGLALGGGGARGLAHVLMLEALDELGVRPARVAGTSIGAIMGAIYCSGISGREIRDELGHLELRRNRPWPDRVLSREMLKMVDWIDPNFGRGGLLKGEGFLRFLVDAIDKETFDELPIPLTVVATDFWERAPVVIESGPIAPAVRASMAIPGLFRPVEREGRILVDGGVVNPVPWDLLHEAGCAATVAIDVIGSRERGRRAMPSFLDAVFNSFQIMAEAITAEKMKRLPPDIYIRPEITGIQALEFYRAADIYDQAATAKDRLKRGLARLLE